MIDDLFASKSTEFSCLDGVFWAGNISQVDNAYWYDVYLRWVSESLSDSLSIGRARIRQEAPLLELYHCS